MTLARVLDAAGELRAPPLNLDCARCDPETRAARGCGVAPDVVTRDPLTGKTVRTAWSPSEFMAEAEERRYGERTARNASRRYWLAAAGSIIEILGEPWDCCPAWWARHVGGAESAVADYAIAISSACRKERPWAVTTDPLSPRMSRLVSIADRGLVFHDRMQMERRKRAEKDKEGGGHG